MGCWNETCGVTQMPIMSGDPVALILLGSKGSQDQSYDLIREIHSVCEDIMRKNEQEWGDEDGEDEHEGDAA